ncbi:hypothetical protein BGZ93_010348 [Podila epicladia]|nr:hypothetical protein BGZ93_010348 [Podila epicladia]
MNPDIYLDTPHYRHPSGTLSSLDYEAEESSVSSMDNQSSFRTNHNNHSTTSTKQSSASTVLGYPHDSVIFDPSKKSSHPQRGLNQYTSSNHTLSAFASPQSSPQSSRHTQDGRGPLPYSSGSEDDHDDTFARDDDSSRSSTYRARRDSGLPPIKLNSAKRLPPFGASTSSIPADSLIEEEEEEEEEEDGSEEAQRRHLRQQQQQQLQQQQKQQLLQQQKRQYYHEDDVESIPLDDDDEEEVVQIRDRDMGSRQINLPKSTENGRSKQSVPGTASQTSFHPFPSPLARPNPAVSTATPTSVQPSQQRASHPSNTRPIEPDRGPADLSNPSMALAEALIAARSKAEGKAQQQHQQQQQQRPVSTNDKGYGYPNNGRKISPTTDTPGPMSQIRIPVPDLSPTLHGYQGHRDGTYVRRTSFTLSPTSSNPELAESHSDSQSGSYGTPRPGGARSIPPTGTKFANNAHLAPRSSNGSYSGDFQHGHSQYRHQKEPSLLGTSYDSANSGHQEGENYSRFAFPGQDLDQQSLPSQGYPDHPSVYLMSGQQYRTSTGSDLENFAPKNNGKQTSNGYRASTSGRHANGAPVSASGSASYPLSVSSHSLAEGEDIQDQVNTEAEYIMNRNTELLRILSIRDEEIQTLQQELDHTLKVIHEYEDDLMAMHTAAAKPYETYNQTLDQIGHEMTQQEAVLQGYKQENEKLTSQLKSSVEIRQEAEKRHLQSVDRLQTEIRQLRTDLEKTDQEKYGSTDLRAQLKQSHMDQDRDRKGFRDKEEEYQLEISELKEQLRVTQQVLESERKSKVEDMQRLQKDIRDFRAGYDGMLQQLEELGPYPHVKRGSSSSSADDGLADTTAGGELERDIVLIKAALMEKAFSTKSTTPSPPISEKQQKESKPKQLDRKLTSTETLTTANMPDSPDMEKMDLEQRISKFEADVRQSLLRSASIESFISVRSSTGTVIPLAAQVKLPRPSHRKSQNGVSREDLRLSAMSEQHKLANKLRDRINSLNIENKRLHAELSSLSHVLRQQQTERQRKVSQLEELLDLHESAAAKALDDASTDEGQARIRKVIQGLLVRIRTKEAEAEFYHNAYLDKVMELDQMALANGKNTILGEEAGTQATVDNLAVSSPTTSSSVIDGLESRVKELERLNLETAFRLTAEQRRAQATEAENATLIREKLTLARMLEDQVEQLQTKLSAAEIAKARLQDDNALLRQGSTEKQENASSSYANNTNNNAANAESLSIMRTRMLSLTRQRDQLREQLQEAFDIQLTMQDRAAGGVPEWSVDDYKRLERALEEKTNELGVWKERAIALEKVVERIRMIKDKPEPTGLSLDRSSRSITDSESVASSSAGSGRHPHNHTLEELDQVVLRLEQRLERRDQELQEVVLEAKRQTDLRLEAWKAKWVQVVQRKNAEIHRFQVELESLMAAVDRDRARMAASMKKQ